MPLVSQRKMAITKAGEGSHLWRKYQKALAVLRLRAMLAVRTCLSTRPVSFITKSEVEVYGLENVVRVMRYGERKKSIKRLKAWAVDVPKNTSTASTSFGFRTMKNQNLMYLVHRGQS